MIPLSSGELEKIDEFMNALTAKIRHIQPFAEIKMSDVDNEIIKLEVRPNGRYPLDKYHIDIDRRTMAIMDTAYKEYLTSPIDPRD